ncbi:MAG TPA: amino acid adenylation domain-containing protein, partial [Rhizomicrobium sp.]|nr:amino acid adenylation domain-containing protein [Rhizomicrobium sp.]
MQVLRRVRDALSSARRGSLSSAAIDGAPAPKISDDLLHGIFLKTAARHPDLIAIRLIDPSPEAARKSELTYKELFERASHFAHYLVLNGVKRGDRVVICLPRGLDQYMAVLGTLLAGAAYVPADYSLPLERLRHIIGDSAAAAVVTMQDRKCGLEDVGAAIVAIDGVLGEIAAPALALPVVASPVGDDLAYIIYTSGSTGVPKGAMICHRNIAFQVRAEGEVLKLTEEDVVYAGASLAFDVSVEEMWAAFLVGAVLLVGSEGLAKNLDELPARLHANRATVWCPVPSLLAAIDHPLPMIRLINAGGEAFPPELVRRWAVGSRRLINTYGPTETAVTVTFAELSQGLPVTIGKPLRGVSIWIVDENLAPVKPGEEGELLIGGPTVGKGYLNDPALTGKKFVAITVPAGRKERAYRTGDLVREDANGDLIFCGRIDLQVKIRGYRVELGEIENVIARDNAVAQVTVKFFDEPDQPQMLAAFVTPRQQSLIIIDRLRGLAAQHLPDYMRPAAYVVASSLPVLISGKIDRRALARPHLPAMDEAPAAQAPETPFETKLLEVWKTIFAPMPVSTIDNF